MTLQCVSLSLVLVTLAVTQANGVLYYVAPNVTDCHDNTPCNTLSHYASSTSLQLTDSVFYFMPGTHRLQQTWTMENASNLTLTGPSPDSKADQEAVVQCTLSNADSGIQVSNGSSIAVKNLEIFFYVQGTVELTGLVCNYTNNLELINLTFVGETLATCLELLYSGDFLVTDCNFTFCGTGIETDGPLFGKMTKLNLLNNALGISLNGIANTPSSLEIDRIYAFNNSIELAFNSCWSNLSLTNSLFDHSGSFYLLFECDYTQQQQEYSVFEMNNCTFHFAVGFEMSVSQSQSLEIRLTSCSFLNPNIPYSAYNVIGIFAEPTPIQNNSVKVALRNVTIEGAYAPGNPPPLLSLSNLQQVEFTHVHIQNNGIGALQLHDTATIFQGNNTFRNNSGYNGGAIALYGNSYIIVKANSTLEITNNTADNFGGGIYVAKDPWAIDRGLHGYVNFCFINFQGESSKIILYGNQAKITGAELYGGDIDICHPIDDQAAVNLTTALGLITNTSDCGQTNVSSDVRQLLFCNNNSINITTLETSVSLYPGTQLNKQVAAIGQLNGLTQANIVLTFDELFDTDEQDLNEFISTNCTNIMRDIHVKTSNTQASIYLAVFDNSLGQLITYPITIVVNILPCPEGFIFSQGKKACVCSDVIVQLAQCDIASQDISRFGTSWISPSKNSIKVFEICPFDYCNDRPFNVMNNSNGSELCNYNRSGILCGGCIQGYSLSFGSNLCLNCMEQAWTLPTILLISALSGIGLVAVLIVLNLTVSLGTINGLLFFVNTVKVYESIFFGSHHNVMLHYFFSWLNLDLGINTCFYNGMDACHKAGLQYVFPLYLLALVVLIVALCRCGEWVGLRSIPWVVKLSDKAALLMGTKIVPVLATLLLLSYTKVIRAIILIYQKADVKVFDPITTDTSNYSIDSRWYVDGNVAYLTGCHRVLFGLSSAITVPFVTAFTTFLLFFPLMEKYLVRMKWWTSWHMLLKPWYDAYGGPYKDEYRFWTGFLLLIRCGLVLVMTFQNDQEVSLSVLMWLCLILIPLVALLQVYKSFVLNILENVYFSCILAMVFLVKLDVVKQRATFLGDEHFRLPVHRHLVFSRGFCVSSPHG